jgi:hypothetical protein
VASLPTASSTPFPRETSWRGPSRPEPAWIAAHAARLAEEKISWSCPSGRVPLVAVMCGTRRTRTEAIDIRTTGSRTMKYMLMIQAATTDEGSGEAAVQCTFEEWASYDKEVKESGIFVSGHSLADLTTATAVRVGAAGERIVTDGPFAESREVLGGYYVIDVPDLDVALDWAARCPGAREGSVVVRPIAEF